MWSLSRQVNVKFFVENMAQAVKLGVLSFFKLTNICRRLICMFVVSVS